MPILLEEHKQILLLARIAMGKFFEQVMKALDLPTPQESGVSNHGNTEGRPPSVASEMKEFTGRCGWMGVPRQSMVGRQKKGKYRFDFQIPHGFDN